MERKKNRRVETLSRSEVLAVALAKVDAEGLDALTMRRLARDLGVEAPSLYNHVANKDALLDGVLELMRSEMRLPEQWPDDWQDQLQIILVEYYRVLTAHPNMMPFSGTRLDDGRGSGLEYLIDEGGFELDQAVELWQSLVALVVGFASLGASSAEAAARGLRPDIGVRLADWREETLAKTLRTIMDAHERARVS